MLRFPDFHNKVFCVVQILCILSTDPGIILSLESGLPGFDKCVYVIRMTIHLNLTYMYIAAS